MNQGIAVRLKCSIDRFKEIAAITTVSKEEKREERKQMVQAEENWN